MSKKVWKLNVIVSRCCPFGIQPDSEHCFGHDVCSRSRDHPPARQHCERLIFCRFERKLLNANDSTSSLFLSCHLVSHSASSSPSVVCRSPLRVAFRYHWNGMPDHHIFGGRLSKHFVCRLSRNSAQSHSSAYVVPHSWHPMMHI